MRSLPLLLASTTALALATAGSTARAQLIIKQPGNHPQYTVELEPHGDLSLFGAGLGDTPHGYAYGSGFVGFGGGFRASIKILDRGFIPSLNNSVGISFGADFTTCPDYACTDSFQFWIPVTLQWNFYLTKQWNAFADLGFALQNDGFFDHVYPSFVAEIGGRYQFSDTMSLTMRLGFPFFSVGVSFFAG
jgi:hypothetical protein